MSIFTNLPTVVQPVSEAAPRDQKQPPEVFHKKAVLKTFAVFTEKHIS